MKKLFALVLTLVLCLCLAAAANAAETTAEGSCGTNAAWKLDSDMTLTISGSGKMTDYSSGTATPWSSYRMQIKSLVIEDGIERIGNYAFQSFWNLTSLTIPDSVTEIGTSAFQSCNSLTSITIPDGVTILSNDVFYGCISLTNVTIPDGVTTIGRSAFQNCSSLTSITIPDSVTLINISAFMNCSSLTSITIPDSVTTIGSGAFDKCTSLAEVRYEGLTNPCPSVSPRSNAFQNCPVTVAHVPQNYSDKVFVGLGVTKPDGTTFHVYSITAAVATGGGGYVTGGGVYASGETVTLSASPRSMDGYTFVGWMENGTIVSTESEYTFPATANRTLTAVFYGKLTVNSEPEDLTVWEGNITEYTFYIVAVPSGTVSYQWYQCDDSSRINARELEGATSEHFVVPKDLTEGVYYFYCVANATNRNPVTSRVLTVTVSKPSQITITVVPDQSGTASSSVTQGIDGRYYATLTATPAEGYLFKEWQVVSGGVDIVNDRFTMGTMDVEIKAVFEETVDAQKLIILAQPESATYTQDEMADALFVTVDLPADGGWRLYQWYMDGAAIGGATGASYIPSTSDIGETSYYCVVTNYNPDATGQKRTATTSDTATITVIAKVHAAEPVITAQPVGATYTEGVTADALTIAATASDEGTLTYQWYMDGEAIDGATDPSYIPATDQLGMKEYYCVITNTNNNATGEKTAFVTTSSVVITVIPKVHAAKPVITAQPVGATYTEGVAADALTVAATASDEGTLTYQWYMDDKAIDGATGTSYTPVTDQLGMKEYYCVITNTNNNATGEKTSFVTTSSVVITVIPKVHAAVPVITTQPVSATYTEGVAADALTVAATVADEGTLTYQWYMDGKAIDGATGTSYTPVTDTVSTKRYSCVVTNTNTNPDVTGEKIATITSNTATITVIAKVHAAAPVITAQPVGAEYTKGAQALPLHVVAVAPDGGELAYQWYENDHAIPGATDETFTPPTDEVGAKVYSCKVTSTNQTATGNQTAYTVSDAVTITVYAPVVVPQTGDNTPIAMLTLMLLASLMGLKLTISRKRRTN